MSEQKRVNNTSWCCDEIEELLKQYKIKFQNERSIGHVIHKNKAEVYLEVIQDLEKILYGESYYE